MSLFKSFDNPGRIVGWRDEADILELTFRHLRAHEMSDQESMAFLDQFSRGQGKDIGWQDEAKVLPERIAERIDRAAFGWLVSHPRTTEHSDARGAGTIAAQNSLAITSRRDWKTRAAGGD